jgi:hypothetical protein
MNNGNTVDNLSIVSATIFGISRLSKYVKKLLEERAPTKPHEVYSALEDVPDFDEVILLWNGQKLKAN